MKRLFSFIMALVLMSLMLVPVGVTAATPTVTQPTGLTSDGSYTGSDGSTVYYYSKASKSNYDTYIETLTAEGYEVLQSYEADSCYYSLLDNGTATVYVSFLRSVSTTSSKGRLRVFVDNSGTPYHTANTATAADVCEPAMWQLDVDNSNSQDGGMSYVIRLTDGTFVVVDGGYSTDAEAKNLYSVLCANNMLGSKPVISAWFITHLHIDHYGVLSNFANKYMDAVTVQAFYYNFPGEQLGDIGPTNATSVENTMKRWTSATRYSKIHSGMVMGFAGATVEVLATHEDVRQSYYKSSYSSSPTANDFAKKSDGTTINGNDTSTVIRFNIAGQSILFLADACVGVSNAMTYTYTKNYIKSDIVQMAHHGFDDGVTDALYESAMESGKSVLLWPMDITRYVDGVLTEGTTGDTKTFLAYFNKDHGQSTAYGRAKDVFPAYQNQKLELPYVAVGNKPTVSQAPDYYGAIAENKVAVNKATNGMRIQMSDDGSSIRFIGVLTADENTLKNNFDSFGFEISFMYKGKTYVHRLDSTVVYTSVIADGLPVEATDLGGTYLYAVQITGLGVVEGDLEFVITGVGTVGEDTFSYGTWTHTVSERLGAGDDGSMISFDFSNIINGRWE